MTKVLFVTMVAAAMAAAAAAQPAPCLIISEVVDGDESGGCPNWIEITNTGTAPYTFTEGGIIVQTDGSSDVFVDLNLTGVTIQPGQAFVINSHAEGCSGAFRAIYGFFADMNTMVQFGDGDDRYILTDRNNGSRLLDIYGEFGVDGTGRPWEYTRGFSYRLPAHNSGNGGVFIPGQWYFGGVGSLSGPDPTQLLLDNTTPRQHAYSAPCLSCLKADANCDRAVNAFDINCFIAAVVGGEPSWTTCVTGGGQVPCGFLCANDLSGPQYGVPDGAVNAFDIDRFVECVAQGGCPQ